MTKDEAFAAVKSSIMKRRSSFSVLDKITKKEIAMTACLHDQLDQLDQNATHMISCPCPKCSPFNYPTRKADQ